MRKLIIILFSLLLSLLIVDQAKALVNLTPATGGTGNGLTSFGISVSILYKDTLTEIAKNSSL